MVKRVSISLDKEQVRLLENIKGLGTKDAEKIKNMFLIYLHGQGYLDEFNRKKNGKYGKG